MSFLDDAFKFEMFHGKDLWGRLKKDPKRLLLGVDPWSTKVWNRVLGRDDKPLVDQMGGAYDGSVLSLGERNADGKMGGVYGRAEAEGVPTNAGRDMQRLAHVIAAYYAAQGLGNIGDDGGASGARGQGDWQDWAQTNPPQQQQQPMAQQPPKKRDTVTDQLLAQQGVQPIPSPVQAPLQQADPLAAMKLALAKQELERRNLGYTV